MPIDRIRRHENEKPAAVRAVQDLSLLSSLFSLPYMTCRESGHSLKMAELISFTPLLFAFRDFFSSVHCRVGSFPIPLGASLRNVPSLWLLPLRLFPRQSCHKAASWEGAWFY
jgi:hypothetical protein